MVCCAQGVRLVASPHHITPSLRPLSLSLSCLSLLLPRSQQMRCSPVYIRSTHRHTHAHAQTHTLTQSTKRTAAHTTSTPHTTTAAAPMHGTRRHSYHVIMCCAVRCGVGVALLRCAGSGVHGACVAALGIPSLVTVARLRHRHRHRHRSHRRIHSSCLLSQSDANNNNSNHNIIIPTRIISSSSSLAHPSRHAC